MPTEAPYYLANFERALAWVAERYDDILSVAERAFLEAFRGSPLASRALLVRMLMRKGNLFRTNRLSYDEIGAPLDAAAPLIALGWVNAAPALSLDELFVLATRSELLQMFAGMTQVKGSRKSDLLDAARALHDAAVSDWHPHWREHQSDGLLRVEIAPLCDRMRLMFFGNLHQDWSEFVLADLGVFQYERVAFEPSSRAFQRRADVDTWLALHECRQALDALPNGAPVDELLARVPLVETEPANANLNASANPRANAWLAWRRAKLLFRVGQHCERQQDWDAAVNTYAACEWPEARHRRIRSLERAGRVEDALSLALEACAAPQNEEESQRVARTLPRLRRQLGHPPPPMATAQPIARSTLVLARPDAPSSVELIARDHLHCAHAPVHYVENALVNSLFGLLCWDAIFAAIPGAFFHPFQRGPADLHAPDFYARRATLFDACLAQLDHGEYRTTILRHFESKAGVQSPFVFWGAVSEALLTLAFDCLPAAHLKLWFERMLQDLRGNRSGLPDLIQFWPAERRYELIEVKGPGDRLQDNQIRWLEYCTAHRMPVRVVDVRWSDELGVPEALPV